MTLSFDAPPWLVAVDLQNVFGDTGSEWFTPDFAVASAGAARLRPAFGTRVALTRFVAPAEPAGAWIPYYRDWPFALVPADDPLYDLVAEIPAGDATIVTRTTFGKWDDGTQDALGHPTDIVLTGVSTDCCILSTALAAADAGVRVRVVADACAGLTPLDHQRALDALSLYAPLIEITTIADVLAALPVDNRIGEVPRR
ncbi:Isochorismatase family protein YecD [Frondihabitans sp. 762G35]|uniref:cysteine hydrolase family protein n=1 Tax=Frondihabitans sp. 762G35 TaxID=1446794 RepID=UPI000D2022F4|nr:cysteine hydrolase [Frondihabitans sp. 762G35]ARC56438.1 Isochorismatase family protein YecD [Frondihabitans sp. 762G35]